MGSGSVSFAVLVGRPLRWTMLFVLAGVALAFGWSNRRAMPRSLSVVAGALAAIGLLSAAWSVTPEITAKRLHAIFGPEFDQLLTGDATQDAKNAAKFASALAQSCKPVPEGNDKVTLEIGN